ncbi:unnamed protein product [Miscanthus lutarioriparius]|uniref:Uncharacterized protein n=1 Tax=Miscanthus lutarioriparius TaxID=422564 RepID=A0A811SHN1_9POAL|nr:unnamed protein product [Miscanthus lutarioriparius]
MSAGAPLSSFDPSSSRVVAPSAPAAMLSPPPAPPAAVQDEKRPSPPMKVKLLFPYAVSCVFGGMGRAWGMAMVGLHAVLCIIKVLSFTTDPEVARFWVPIFSVWVYLGIAAIVLMTCVNIVYYMPVYGVYAMKYDLPPQQPAAAVVATPEQLPPPPPEMDMC